MLIIIVVFALCSRSGVEGKLFRPMAVSIVLAMLTSLVVPLVVPALASYSLPARPEASDSPVFKPFDWATVTCSGQPKGPVVGLYMALGLFAERCSWCRGWAPSSYRNWKAPSTSAPPWRHPPAWRPH